MSDAWLGFHVDLASRSDADRRGHFVVQLATLTLLIDAGLATVEEAAQRIELIQSTLPAPYQAEDVANRVKFVTAWLRGHVPQPRGQWKPVVIEGGLDRDLSPDQDPQKT